jgi:hypothetical protein
MSDLQPMTLLDLDSAGLDPTKIAPPEFITFLYDNSQVMYITLWSHILAEPDGASKITRWLDASIAAYRQRVMQVQVVAPATAEKPVGDHITEVTYSGPVVAPPVNVDVPLLSGPAGLSGTVGDTLTCTMGNWEGEPDTYVYQFTADGIELVSGDSNTYAVAAPDAGKNIACIVTATNSGGSVAAPPSNAILVAGARSAGTGRSGSADVGRGDDTKVSGTASQERTTRRST